MKTLVKSSSLIIFTSLVISCVTGTSLKNVNDLSRLKLLGKVKSIMETTYTAIDNLGEIQKGKTESSWSKRFDKTGMEVKPTVSESKSDEDVYKYDDKGNEIEWYKIETNGSLILKRTLKYDSRGNIIEGNDYNSNKLLERKTINKFDSGNMIEQSMYKSDGSLISKSVYKYDNKGNCIEINCFKSNATLLERYVYKWDDKSNMIESNAYKSDGTLREKQIYKFDENSNEIERDFFNSDGSAGGKWFKKYDNKKNLIELNYYNSDGNLSLKDSYVYTFDKMGNWIKKIIYKNEIPQQFIERIIEYYLE